MCTWRVVGLSRHAHNTVAVQRQWRSLPRHMYFWLPNTSTPRSRHTVNRECIPTQTAKLAVNTTSPSKHKCCCTCADSTNTHGRGSRITGHATQPLCVLYRKNEWANNQNTPAQTLQRTPQKEHTGKQLRKPARIFTPLLCSQPSLAVSASSSSGSYSSTFFPSSAFSF